MSIAAEAAAAAGRILAITRAERDGAYARGGALAVAEYVAKNGTEKQRTEIAAHYEILRKRAADAA